jgi:hypothetical protein
MANSSKGEVMKTTLARIRWLIAIAAGALALHAASAAGAQTIQRAIGGLEKYNTEEANLSTRDRVSPSDLIAHWKRLDLIASNVEQLDRAGRLSKLDPTQFVVLRHELVQLFEATPDIMDGKNGRLVTADHKRRQALIRIALVANRRFNLGIREVLGQRLDAGVS